MNHLETCYFGEIGDLVIDVFVLLCFQHSYYDQTHREDADQLCCSCRLCQWRQVCPSSSTVNYLDCISSRLQVQYLINFFCFNV